MVISWLLSYVSAVIYFVSNQLFCIG